MVALVPANLLGGEDVSRVDVAAIPVDLLAGDAGCAGTGFEVEAYAGEVGEFVGTPWTLDVFAGVG